MYISKAYTQSYQRKEKTIPLYFPTFSLSNQMANTKQTQQEIYIYTQNHVFSANKKTQ